MRRFMICFFLASLLALTPATVALASPGPSSAAVTIWGGFADALQEVAEILRTVFHKSEEAEVPPQDDPPPTDPEDGGDENENGPSMDPNGGN